MRVYECPFQTPGSTALRRLRQSKTIRVLLGSLSPLKVISLVYTAWKKTRWALVLAPYCVYKVTRSSSFREISVSRIRSGIRSIATKVGHQAIILLLQIDCVFGNVKQRLVQGARRFRHVHLLPIAVRDTHCQPSVTRNGPGLRVRVWNVENIRGQNTHHARCVSWVLRNITDPETIDSVIHLAGTIRWFNGGSDHDPPFYFIVSTFKVCFASPVFIAYRLSVYGS